MSANDPRRDRDVRYWEAVIVLLIVISMALFATGHEGWSTGLTMTVFFSIGVILGLKQRYE